VVCGGGVMWCEVVKCDVVCRCGVVVSGVM
jgi:hypothetical protein